MAALGTCTNWNYLPLSLITSLTVNSNLWLLERIRDLMMPGLYRCEWLWSEIHADCLKKNPRAAIWANGVKRKKQIESNNIKCKKGHEISWLVFREVLKQAKTKIIVKKFNLCWGAINSWEWKVSKTSDFLQKQPKMW